MDKHIVTFGVGSPNNMQFSGPQPFVTNGEGPGRQVVKEYPTFQKWPKNQARCNGAKKIGIYPTVKQSNLRPVKGVQVYLR